MLKRKPDWERLLGQFLLDRRFQPFVKGTQDCSMLACDAILAITGTDIAADVRGKYTTKEEADALLNQLTNGSDFMAYVAHIAATYEIPEVPLLLARRGDCVIFTHENVSSLGIIGTDGVYAYFAGEAGLERLKVRDCDKAWRIG
jgi:hypothetical protein